MGGISPAALLIHPPPRRISPRIMPPPSSLWNRQVHLCYSFLPGVVPWRRLFPRKICGLSHNLPRGPARFAAEAAPRRAGVRNRCGSGPLKVQ